MNKGTSHQGRLVSEISPSSVIDLDKTAAGSLALSLILAIEEEDELTEKLIEAIRTNKLKHARKLCDQLHSLRTGKVLSSLDPQAVAAGDEALRTASS